MDLDAPTATELYRGAWSPLRTFFFDLLLIALVWIALAIPGGILREVNPALSGLYHLLVTVPLDFGALYAYLRAARAERPRLPDLFVAFRTAYGQTLLAHVLFLVVVGAGFVCLIVPGLILASRLAFVGFLVIDRQLDAAAAFRESWRLTEGHGGRILRLWFLGIPLSIAGLILFGVGIVPAVMWMHLATAVLFVYVTEHDRQEGARLASSAVGR